jgi:hypothetical protein
MSDSLAATSPYLGFSFLFAHSYSLIAAQPQIKLRCRRARPVLPEEAVILRYLDFLGGEANVDTLGTALGFALFDDFTATPMRYRDVAEAALWSDLLDDLESYGLLKRLNDIVRCTPSQQ